MSRRLAFGIEPSRIRMSAKVGVHCCTAKGSNDGASHAGSIVLIGKPSQQDASIALKLLGLCVSSEH
jgi:hypothetical protein